MRRHVRIGTGITGMIALRNLNSDMLGAPGAGRCPVFELVAAQAENDRETIRRRHAEDCARARQERDRWRWED